MAPSSGGGDAAPSYNNVVFGDAKSRKNVAKKHLINPPTRKFITRRSKILSNLMRCMEKQYIMPLCSKIPSKS